MRIRNYLLVAAVVLGFGLTGCGNDVGSVGGRGISKEEFNTYLKFKRIPEGDAKQRELVLNEYLEREALSTAIEKEGFLDEKAIQMELNEFKKEMLISRYFEKYLKDKVSDEAVQNYYNTHAAQYEERRVHVAHILIRTNSAMKDAERKAKLTSAQQAYSLIKSGKDFAETAKKFTEDKISAQKGGDLGWLKQGVVDPNFSKRIFELQAGEVSEPFESAFGFHIVKVLEAPTLVKQPFNAVAGDIRYQLRNETKKAEVDRLMKKEKIKKKS